MSNLGIIFFISGIVILAIGLILCLINLKKNIKTLNKVIIAILILGVGSTTLGGKSMLDTLKSQKNSAIATENNQLKDTKTNIDTTSNKATSEDEDIINMEVSIYQNDPYSLPLYLQNVSPNGDIKEIAVTWDPAKLDTSKIGTHIFTGVVPELSKKVKLTLNITSNNIAQENNPTKEINVEKVSPIQNKVFGMVNNNTIYYLGERSLRYYNKQVQNKPKSMSFAWSRGFCVIDDKIYYIEDGRKLHKINFDGSDKTMVSSDDIADFVADEKHIYYAHFGDTKLYRMNLDGTDKQLITNDTPNSMVIDNGWLYYSNASDKGKLYKIKVDGTERTALTSSAVSCIDVEGDFIYFVQYLENSDRNISTIFRIKKDGTMNTKLTEEKAYYMKVYKGYIYFTENNSGPNSIHKMKIDGTDLKTLPLTDIYCFTFYNDSIFSVRNEGSMTMYKTDLEGRRPEQLPM